MVGMTFADPETTNRLVQVIPILASQLSIPRGQPIYSLKRDRNVDADLMLLYIIPRLSNHGLSVQASHRGLESDEQALVDVPRYSQFWPHEYRLREPLAMSAGSLLELGAEFSAPSAEPLIAANEPLVVVESNHDDEEVVGLFEVVAPYTDPIKTVTKELLDPTRNVSIAIAGLAITTLVCLIILSLKPVHVGPAPAAPLSPPPDSPGNPA